MSVNIGELIRKRRKELKMTQKDVYEKMGIEDTGLISKYENNDVTPPFEMVIMLADALDVSVGYFAGEISEKSSENEKEILGIFRLMDNATQMKALAMMRVLYQ